MKITKKELMEMIRQEAALLKTDMLEESDAVETVVDPLKATMNQNDGLEDSDKALTYKSKTKKTEKAGTKPAETKMNAKDSDQGSDKDAATAVEVEAGAKKGGKGHTAGQAKANFTSKKEMQDTKASGPFDDRVGDVKMNSEDKLVDEKAKTYVSAGAAKGGKTHTAGQAKAEVHERIPAKDVDEKEDRIADGIEIDGSNIKLKETYTKSELKEFILSEARKAVLSHNDSKKKEVKKSELIEELKTICENLEECGMDMEEGLGTLVRKATDKLGVTDSDEAQEANKKTLMDRIIALKTKGYKKFFSDKKEMSEEQFNQVMAGNKFTGKLITAPKQAAIVYQPGKYGASRLGTGGASHGLGV